MASHLTSLPASQELHVCEDLCEGDELLLGVAPHVVGEEAAAQRPVVLGLVRVAVAVGVEVQRRHLKRSIQLSIIFHNFTFCRIRESRFPECLLLR